MVTFGVPADGGEDDDFLDQQPADDQGDDDFMSDDDDDDFWSVQNDGDDDVVPIITAESGEVEHHPLPVHAPPAAAASEVAAATAALEAAEAPGDDCCPVCLLQDGGEAPPAARPWSRVAPCGHRFHAACVEKWLKVKLICPVCRCPARRRRGAAAPEPPRPFLNWPGIVDEFLALGFEESIGFDMTPRWVDFSDDAYAHITANSSPAS